MRLIFGKNKHRFGVWKDYFIWAKNVSVSQNLVFVPWPPATSHQSNRGKCKEKWINIYTYLEHYLWPLSHHLKADKYLGSFTFWMFFFDCHDRTLNPCQKRTFTPKTQPYLLGFMNHPSATPPYCHRACSEHQKCFINPLIFLNSLIYYCAERHFFRSWHLKLLHGSRASHVRW